MHKKKAGKLQTGITFPKQYWLAVNGKPKIGIYKLKDFMNCIKVKRNNLLNSIYSSVSPDFRFKDTPYVNFFTDPEMSSSLHIYKIKKYFYKT